MPIVTRLAKSTLRSLREIVNEVLARLLAVGHDVDSGRLLFPQRTSTASRLASASAGPDWLQGAHSTPGFASHEGLGRLPAIVVESMERF